MRHVGIVHAAPGLRIIEPVGLLPPCTGAKPAESRYFQPVSQRRPPGWLTPGKYYVLWYLNV